MFDISSFYPIFQQFAFYFEHESKNTLFNLGLVNKYFMSYFIPLLWNKYAYTYFLNSYVHCEGNQLLQILFHDLPQEFQLKLSNKDIYNKNYNDIYDKYDFDKIIFIKQNYIFNYSSFLSELPCSLIADFINNNQDKDYVIGLFISYYFNLIKR